MQPTPQLLRDLRREKVLDARQQTFAQKFMAGAELFDYACEIAKAGIRMQNPRMSEAQVMDELRRRVNMSRLIEAEK